MKTFMNSLPKMCARFFLCLFLSMSLLASATSGSPADAEQQRNSSIGNNVRSQQQDRNLQEAADTRGQNAGARGTQQPSEDPAQKMAHLQEITRYLMSMNPIALRRGSAQALAEMIERAASRRGLLEELIEEYPGEILRVAIPPSFSQGMPESVRPFIEESVDTEGLLEIYDEDGIDRSRLLFQLEIGKQRYSLHFAGEPPTQFQTGARVRVRGVKVGNAVALEAKGVTASPSAEYEMAAALPNTFGEQRTLVMLVNFQDKTSQPYSVEYARNVVFTTTSDFMGENSYGQTWLSGDVAGWYTIPMSSSVCDHHTLASYALQAASAAGYNVSAYKRHIFGFPSNLCSWWGMGSVGGSPSSTWVKGSFSLAVVGHELGHNLGLYHSRSMDCGASVLGNSCSYSEYGDPLDIMGNSYYAHFNAYQKERLGWLNYGISPGITAAQTSGDYYLDNYQTPGTTPKALKIFRSTDPSTGYKDYYYLEFRSGLGFDSPLGSNSNVQNGMVFHLGTESSPRNIYILDMTPETSSWSDPALTIGSGYTDTLAGVTITPLSTGSTGAKVNISFGSKACVQTMPQATLTPSKGPWVPPGTPVLFDFTVSNKDGEGCAPATFSLNAGLPAGWSGAYDKASLAVAPGSSATARLQISSPFSSPDGFYDFTATASNSADPPSSASSVGTYVVASALDVSITVDRANYSTNQWVNAAATIKSGGSPVAGMQVTFTLTRPNGTTVIQSAITSSNGTATFKYRINKKDSRGAYQIRADAVTGSLSGTALVGFMVQ